MLILKFTVSGLLTLQRYVAPNLPFGLFAPLRPFLGLPFQAAFRDALRRVWKMPIVQNGQSNLLRMTNLNPVRMVIPSSLEWSFPVVWNGHFDRLRMAILKPTPFQGSPKYFTMSLTCFGVNILS